MNNLITEMAKAHHGNGLGFSHWDALTDGVKAQHTGDMKAALEVLGVKLLPNEFCQHFKAASINSEGVVLPVDLIQCAFKYAINQTLKDES